MVDIVVHTFQTHQVRTLLGEDGEPRFVLADICAALSINNVGNVVKSLDEDNIHTMDVTDAIGRTRKTNVVTEPGLYEVIFQSRKPEAKAFRRRSPRRPRQPLRMAAQQRLALQQPWAPMEQPHPLGREQGLHALPCHTGDHQQWLRRAGHTARDYTGPAEAHHRVHRRDLQAARQPPHHEERKLAMRPKTYYDRGTYEPIPVELPEDRVYAPPSGECPF